MPFYRPPFDGATPAELGYYFPAEWARHRATWLTWPHKEASWPGKLNSIYPEYARFVAVLAKQEQVCINVLDENHLLKVQSILQKNDVPDQNIRFYIHPNNDAWCRDHGPAFLLNHNKSKLKVIIDWDYNAWGDKYPPYDLDDVIPTKICDKLGLKVFHPGIVMEGGSVEFNGQGTLLTTTACLLNPNRNPHLDQKQIEGFLHHFYGVKNILWLGDGIDGDDTDGHIDDLTRFVNTDTVVTVVEEKRSDENYTVLQNNLKALSGMRLENGKQLNIIELPMPAPVIYEKQRLPASYANFYIANNSVIVPTYRHANDERALNILQSCFPQHKVIGIYSSDIIWGLGSFHCLSQQEPE